MTVEVNGIYLTALEKIAEEYNKKSLEMWDNGQQPLRKKQTVETIFKEVIIEYLQIKYPDVFYELVREVTENINGNVYAEDFDEFCRCVDEQLELVSSRIKGSDLVSPNL